MPRINTAPLSHNRKRSLRNVISINRALRWSNKENLPPTESRHECNSDANGRSNVPRKSHLALRLTTTQRALQRERKKSAKHAKRAEAALTREHKEQERTHTIIGALRDRNKELEHATKIMDTQRVQLLDERGTAQRHIRALKEKIRRFHQSLKHARAVKKTNPSFMVHLRKKRVYTTQARSLARTLVHAGCAPRKVAKVIKEMAGVLNAKVVGEMSARTVQRVGLEGLLASDIQAGYELGVAKATTISQDSTSNRHVNFESHHYALQVAKYSEGEVLPSVASEHKVRLLRVDSTLDHGSVNSKNAWLQQLSEVEKTYTESPLGQRSTTPNFSVHHFALILKGMHGDHASSKKSTVKLIGEWKQEETLVDLGEKRLLEVNDIQQLLAYLSQKKSERIETLGGIENWERMLPIERSCHKEKLMHDLKLEIGKEVYNTLSDFDRRMLNLFVWAGCCMHKDQNSFKGGNTEMMNYWAKNDLQGPILLANKFNVQKVRDILDPSRKNAPVTADEQITLENTTRGGAKTAAIAGAIFNNKDDKKGYGDTYQMFRESEDLGDKICARFPDTSNTRFNSHADASAELLVHLSFYRRFLEHVRDSKKQPGWTNIETNLYNALHDVPTLTELAAMVLYSQSVTHPYMRQVRGPGTEKTNILDLGPLHMRVRAHCETIIGTPNILVSSDAKFEAATLDGTKWENTKAIQAVQSMIPRLPHLPGIVRSFFEGALATWVRFSTEFAPGGLIDSANAEEKKLAWMPSTNDTNEGALGAYRVYMRNKPSTTVLQYNAYAVWERNDTQSFMDALFTEEDNAYIRRKARDWDAQGRERERKKALKEHSEKQVEIRREKDAQKVKNAEQRRARLLKVIISTKGSDLLALKVPQIDDQLDALKEIYGDIKVPAKSTRGKKSDKAKHLEDAIARLDSQRIVMQEIVEKDLLSAISSWEDEDEDDFELED